MQQARLEGEQRQRQQPGFVSYYLAAGHVMARDVAKGEILRLEDVHVPRDTVLFKLRQQQEALRDEDWAPPPPQQQKLSDERQAELSVVGVGEQARLWSALVCAHHDVFISSLVHRASTFFFFLPRREFRVTIRRCT
jgi:hypothetical protein